MNEAELKTQLDNALKNRGTTGGFSKKNSLDHTDSEWAYTVLSPEIAAVPKERLKGIFKEALEENLPAGVLRDEDIAVRKISQKEVVFAVRALDLLPPNAVGNEKAPEIAMQRKQGSQRQPS